MRLIKISDDVLVNPDCISMVELKKSGDKKELVVWVDGQKKIATISAIELMSILADAGINYDNRVWQFWAG